MSLAPQPEKPAMVSVIIATHNRREVVGRAVESLLHQVWPRNRYEIIVVCDRCDDGTESALGQAYGERVRVLRTLAGKAAALNAGWKAARGELAIFVDDEVNAVPTFIEAHVEAHQTDSPVAVTGYSPVALEPESSPLEQHLAASYERFFREMERPGRASTPLDLGGFNCSVPVAALRGVGGFDENLVFQRDDFEIAQRLLDAGYSFRFCRAARADQKPALTVDTWLLRVADRVGNDLRLARQHPRCVPYLPFYGRVCQQRWKYRVVWALAVPLTILLAWLRPLLARSMRLAVWEYEARYCAALKQRTSWSDLEQLCHTKGQA